MNQVVDKGIPFFIFCKRRKKNPKKPQKQIKNNNQHVKGTFSPLYAGHCTLCLPPTHLSV